MELEINPAVRYQTKQEMVYQTLRSAIMRCQLKPGQRLVIDDLAQRLSVSPIPVREALQMLLSEGLVENVPHVGASVARISADSLVEIFTLMEALEVVATRIAATRMTAQQKDQLRSILAEIDGVIQSGAEERYAELNTQFHRTIAQITGMRLLQEMTDRVLDRWHRVRHYFFHQVLVYRMEKAQHEHYAMLEAMQAQDFPRLAQLVAQHNQGALQAYVEHLKNPAIRIEQA